MNDKIVDNYYNKIRDMVDVVDHRRQDVQLGMEIINISLQEETQNIVNHYCSNFREWCTKLAVRHYLETNRFISKCSTQNSYDNPFSLLSLQKELINIGLSYEEVTYVITIVESQYLQYFDDFYDFGKMLATVLSMYIDNKNDVPVTYASHR